MQIPKWLNVCFTVLEYHSFVKIEQQNTRICHCPMCIYMSSWLTGDEVS